MMRCVKGIYLYLALLFFIGSLGMIIISSLRGDFDRTEPTIAFLMATGVFCLFASHIDWHITENKVKA
jgi:hypothetical protein